MIWAGLIGVAALAAGGLLLHRQGVAAVTDQVTRDGRRVLAIRPKWLRKVMAQGLTPLALVYRVTTLSEGAESKPHVRLYAYDLGQFFSRGNRHVRYFSGGVWRNP